MDAAPQNPTRAYRSLALGMLLLVYTSNFLDRQILGILAGPIKAELGRTDTQLGALGGIAFALRYRWRTPAAPGSSSSAWASGAASPRSAAR